MAKQEILLEAGTGELEILQFEVNSVEFAINVAKVQEIVIKQRVIPTPVGRTGVKGMINIRNSVYTVLDLKKILFDIDLEPNDDVFYILTNFNNLNIAFLVENVKNIKRCEWCDMIKPSVILNSGDKAGITGILNLDGQIISILDFEKIVTDIAPELGLKSRDVCVSDDLIKARSKYNVLVADDSKTLNRMITDTLSKAGYNVISVEDGKQAYEYVKNNLSKLHLFVSDVEMPVMDGLECSKKLKEEYPKFPIIIFSSLVNEALVSKVSKLNINALITKPEIGKLVKLADELINAYENEGR